MRVFVIDGATGFGGSAISLSNFLRIFVRHGDCVSSLCADPRVLNTVGEACGEFYSRGFLCRLPRIDISLFGFWSGFRNLIVIRELSFLARVLYRLLIDKRLVSDIQQADLILVNEIIDLPAFFLFEKLVGMGPNCRVVCFCRCVVASKGFYVSLIRKALSYTDVVICIDDLVAERFFRSTDVRGIVIPNIPFDAKGVEFPGKERLLTSTKGKISLGFVGGSSPGKGLGFALSLIDNLPEQYELLTFGRIEKPSYFLKLCDRLLSTYNKSRSLFDFKLLDKLVSEGRVRHVGWVEDHCHYNVVDLLLFPSEFGSIGRPSYEFGYRGVLSCVFMFENNLGPVFDDDSLICLNNLDVTEWMNRILASSSDELVDGGLRAKARVDLGIRMSMAKIESLRESIDD